MLRWELVHEACICGFVTAIEEGGRSPLVRRREGGLGISTADEKEGGRSRNQDH
jgi:hypothetical protein